jgi:hypothetical protein
LVAGRLAETGEGAMEGTYILLDDQDRPLSGFVGTEPIVAADAGAAHVYASFDDAWEKMESVNTLRARSGLGRISFALCEHDGRVDDL